MFARIAAAFARRFTENNSVRKQHDGIAIAANETATRLREQYPPLNELYAQRSLGGLTEAAIAKCLSSDIPRDKLVVALEAFALTTSQPDREYGFTYGCVTTIAQIARRHGVGFEQLKNVIEADALSSNELGSLCSYYVGATQPEYLGRLIQLFRPVGDPTFHTFLTKNMSELAPVINEVSQHLLEPDRGPHRGNVDSFVDILKNYPHAEKLRDRLLDWLRNGKFTDPSDRMTNVVFFHCLMEEWPSTAGHVRDELFSEAASRAIDLLSEAKSLASFDGDFAEGFILLHNAVSQAAELIAKGHVLDTNVRLEFGSVAMRLKVHYEDSVSSVGEYSALNPLIDMMQGLADGDVLVTQKFNRDLKSPYSAARITADYAWERHQLFLDLKARGLI